jgi:hypothetical protein
MPSQNDWALTMVFAADFRREKSALQACFPGLPTLVPL